MAKKIKLEVTEAQLASIINITDDVSGMVGCGDFDKEWKRYIKNIDAMLVKNGYKRTYN